MSFFSSCSLNTVYYCVITVLGFPFLWSIDMETSLHLPSLSIPYSSLFASHPFLKYSVDQPAQNWLILSMQTLSFSLAWHVCDIFSNLMFELLVDFNRLVVLGALMISSSHQLLTSWWMNQQFTPLLAHVNLILWMLSCHTTEQSLKCCGFWHELHADKLLLVNVSVLTSSF